MKLLLTRVKKSEGYTLIELLAVIVILAVVGFVVVAILVSTLRGKNKTSVLNEVTQNGNRVVLQMAKTIEYAKRFEGVKVNTGDLSVLDCTSASPVITPTPVPTQYKYVLVRDFYDTVIEYSCQGNEIASNGASLIDTTVFKATDCYFTCSQSFATSAPSIGIHFTLSNATEETFAEKQVLVPFETTVVMRNVND